MINDTRNSKKIKLFNVRIYANINFLECFVLAFA